MKFRRTLRFHNLKRPKIRQTWNKYNLYNIYKLLNKLPISKTRTLFQQKWVAKKLTRAYHGEHIKENQWERMFSRRLNSVVNMDPKYMAASDGSEQAAGRGSGKQLPPYVQDKAMARELGLLKGQAREPSNVKKAGVMTPYMQMAYAPMERRLDIAVFRALFASSARQARQFVVHGDVKVNGKKMTYPGYLLNPGDLFQVDPERVLFATGARKRKATLYEEYLDGGKGRKTEGKTPKLAESDGAEEAIEADVAENSSTLEITSTKGKPSPAEEPQSSVEKLLSTKATDETTYEDLEKLIQRARKLLRVCKGHLKTTQDNPGKYVFVRPKKMNLMKRKRTIRKFIRETQAAIINASRTPVNSPVAVVRQLRTLLRELAQTQSSSKSAMEDPKSKPKALAKKDEVQDLSQVERRLLYKLLREDAANPVDASKPYATPWRPRPFMSPFVFIPRYLEVNQNICAAVYLRHPVARPGMAEVPTPYPEGVGQLAHNWYLRRR